LIESTERGGVLGAMKPMSQRGKIQRRKVLQLNEMLKQYRQNIQFNWGNTFLSQMVRRRVTAGEVIRAATKFEKEAHNQNP